MRRFTIPFSLFLCATFVVAVFAASCQSEPISTVDEPMDESITENEDEPMDESVTENEENDTNESTDNEQEGIDALNAFENWLNLSKNGRANIANEDFAKTKLSKAQAEMAVNIMHKNGQAELMNEFGVQWENRELILGDKAMPFFYQRFGNPPADGSSLYISMHGGGNTTQAMNDQQYQNQKHLYDGTMRNLEGIYLAPRAPTNTWNLWHERHVEELFNVLIQLAVIKEGVNPNKVYLLGYSAGGDGVYKLAPRMADYFAAASMMAGHPNGVDISSVRNLPFAIHVGAQDTGFNRNTVGQTYIDRLDDLAGQNPGDYIHQGQIHAGKGHWMDLQDAVALPWMAGFTRRNNPKKVTWVQEKRDYTFYWLGTDEDSATAGQKVEVEYNGSANTVNIIENSSNELWVYLNDDMVDLNMDVVVTNNGQQIYSGKVSRNILSIYNSLRHKGDLNMAYTASLRVNNNATVVVP